VPIDSQEKTQILKREMFAAIVSWHPTFKNLSSVPRIKLALVSRWHTRASTDF